MQTPALLIKQLEAEAESEIREFLTHFFRAKELLVKALQEQAVNGLEEAPQSAIDELDGIANPIPLYEVQEAPGNLSGFAVQKCNQIVANLYESGNYNQAVDIYTFLSFLEPKEVAYQLGLGHSHYFVNQFEQAILAYRACIELEPDNPHHRMYLAHCYHGLHLDREAITHVDRALELIKNDKQYAEWEEAARELKADFTLSMINK